jgi:hypothetical protein
MTEKRGRTRKGGYVGDRMWQAHRLEGVVRNKGIKPSKKKPINK